MTRTPTSTTRLLALLGDPVLHSLSPAFQNAALEHAGLDAVFLAIRASATDLPGLLRGIAHAGGAGNVTVPHKAAAADIVDEVTDAVRATGACNTFWLEDGRIRGDNTDVAGFGAAVEALLGRTPAGARVLLVGAGGAASAALHSLVVSGAAEVIVRNRSPERAHRLIDRVGIGGVAIDVAAADAALEGQSFDLVVNATSLGLRADDPFPLPLVGGPQVGAVLDLVYHPGRTAWVRAARDLGIPAEDGLEMLLQQGAAAFERWWRTPAPLAAMRAALPAR